MTDSTLNRFISSGTNAERLAFTPNPATPASGPDPSYIWHETDTADTYAWNFDAAAWGQVNGGIAAIADGDVYANISGASASPTGEALSDVLDHILGSSQGDIIFRGASGWTVLAPGAAGNVLQTGGASANPSWAAAASSGATTLISSVSPSSTTTVSFTSIPGTYKHLRIVGSARSTSTGTGTDVIAMTFNSDTTSAHYEQQFLASNGTASANSIVSAALLRAGEAPKAGDLANASCSFVVDIPLYAGATFFKNILTHYNTFTAGAVTNLFYIASAGVWIGTPAAITQIDLILTGNWVAGSEVSLYGIS